MGQMPKLIIYICRMLYLFYSFLFDKCYSSIRKHSTFLRCVFPCPLVKRFVKFPQEILYIYKFPKELFI